MRKLVIALTAAAGFALLPSTGAMAAPFGGVALDTAATAASTTIDVSYRRHHYRHHHRHCHCWHHRPVYKWKWVKVCKWVKVKYRVR